MQQTTTYKLNLIETDDVFSPEPLNQNTQKVEAALSDAAAALAGLAVLSRGPAAPGGGGSAGNPEVLGRGTGPGWGQTGSSPRGDAEVWSQRPGQQS